MIFIWCYDKVDENYRDNRGFKVLWKDKISIIIEYLEIFLDMSVWSDEFF